MPLTTNRASNKSSFDKRRTASTCAEFDAVTHQVRNLGFGVGRQHQEGQIDTPVGGIRDVRDPRIRIEADIVLTGVPDERTARAFAHRRQIGEVLLEAQHSALRRREQVGDFLAAYGI